jgi:hypothetical protein
MKITVWNKTGMEMVTRNKANDQQKNTNKLRAVF